ncbi:nudix hydrolase homolog 9 [Actinidia rufa]|uniref:Nudix hydrolase homolog 9 n=1 Tax=Actinidia rufa TaxID=165716 RepID=A0A7J0H4D7_9ERIC|nr:nudix hydrolase homolog 9 [Actinidia rufa]
MFLMFMVTVNLIIGLSLPKWLFVDDCQQCKHTSSPLGNGAAVETSDQRILVLQRSYNVGEFPGHYVFPGGHPEPQEVGIVSHQYDKDSGNAELINKKISREMFDSIVREVVEEIGVPAASLCNPAFIGISLRVLNVRPTAFFVIKCSLQSKDIQQLILVHKMATMVCAGSAIADLVIMVSVVLLEFILDWLV